MFNNKLYNSSDCYVGLAVKLPECGDQLGVIEFKNCHDMSMLELAQHIRHDMSIMTYCYKKTQMLKTEHPYLCDVENRLLSPRNEQVYNDPLFLKPGISLSNIGHWGYETPVSPLFPNETAKFTLAKIERKQVWNTTTNQFEVQDILPVGLSVDHRVFDANIPVPYYMQAAFDQMFIAMEQSIPKSYSQPFANLDTFIESSNKIIEKDLELGFLYLFYSAQVWSNFSSYDGLMKKIEVQK